MKKLFPLIAIICFSLILGSCSANTGNNSSPANHLETVSISENEARPRIESYINSKYAPMKMTDLKHVNHHSDAAGAVKDYYSARIGDDKTSKEGVFVIYREKDAIQVREATEDEIKNETKSSGKS